MNFKNGFTLAEVLITLVIIGIIAAMTIPSLMNKTNEQELVVATKKAYSVLNQAYQRVMAENGEIIPSALGSNTQEATTTFGEMFAKQLNTQKICGTSRNGDCFADGQYKLLSGSPSTNLNIESNYKIRLNDGMSVSLLTLNLFILAGSSEQLQKTFGEMYVDVNGNKGPNTFGKDTFKFWITKYGIVPVGALGDYTSSLTCSRNDSGTGCTAWVITKGNMDYLYKDISW